MDIAYRIVNYETGEVFERIGLTDDRSLVCGTCYKIAMSWKRGNARNGLKCSGRKRGVHLYALDCGMVAWEIPLR
jgi:hypothetical protein